MSDMAINGQIVFYQRVVALVNKDYSGIHVINNISGGRQTQVHMNGGKNTSIRNTYHPAKEITPWCIPWGERWVEQFHVI